MNIHQDSTVSLESKTFLLPVTLSFFPMVKPSVAQALPIGEGPHPDPNGWCSASANPSVNLARLACRGWSFIFDGQTKWFLCFNILQ